MVRYEGTTAPSSGRPCPACGHADPGLEECGLLRQGASSSAGNCELHQRIVLTARRHIRLRYPERLRDVDDTVQEVWLRLAKPGTRGGSPPGGPVFRSWLRSVVFHCITDLFRRQRVIAKTRCGSCAHFGSREPRGCRKGTVRDPATGDEAPNPWFGSRVGAESVPRSLTPPCGEFLWRYRPAQLDDSTPARPASTGDSITLVERPGGNVLAALARLGSRGPEAMRRAHVVYRHHVEGEPMEQVARSLGITSRTARRDVRRAFQELREILEEP